MNPIGKPQLGQAEQLENLSNCNDLLAKAFPSICQLDEHHAGQQLALIAKVTGFISHNRDGRFAILMWEAIKNLPDVLEYIERVGEVNLLFSDRPHEVVLSRGGWRNTVLGLFHDTPWLFDALLDSNAPGPQL